MIIWGAAPEQNPHRAFRGGKAYDVAITQIPERRWQNNRPDRQSTVCFAYSKIPTEAFGNRP